MRFLALALIFRHFQIISWTRAIVLSILDGAAPRWGVVTDASRSRWWWSRGVSGWGMLAKCRKLFSWRGFQPLDWGGKLPSGPCEYLGVLHLSFLPGKKMVVRVNAKSTKVASFTSRTWSTNPWCESRMQPAMHGPPLSIQDGCGTTMRTLNSIQHLQR